MSSAPHEHFFFSSFRAPSGGPAASAGLSPRLPLLRLPCGDAPQAPVFEELSPCRANGCIVYHIPPRSRKGEFREFFGSPILRSFDWIWGIGEFGQWEIGFTIYDLRFTIGFGNWWIWAMGWQGVSIYLLSPANRVFRHIIHRMDKD